MRMVWCSKNPLPPTPEYATVAGYIFPGGKTQYPSAGYPANG